MGQVSSEDLVAEQEEKLADVLYDLNWQLRQAEKACFDIRQNIKTSLQADQIETAETFALDYLHAKAFLHQLREAKATVGSTATQLKSVQVTQQTVGQLKEVSAVLQKLETRDTFESMSKVVSEFESRMQSMVSKKDVVHDQMKDAKVATMPAESRVTVPEPTIQSVMEDVRQEMEIEQMPLATKKKQQSGKGTRLSSNATAPYPRRVTQDASK